MPASLYTPAELLLVELCKRATPAPGKVVGMVPPGDEGLLLDLTALSIQHSVQGLVFSRLETLQAASIVFIEYRSRIRSALTLLRRQAGLWDLEQDRVLAGLGKAGFQPLVLKGGALRRWAFQSVVERTVGDLDLLVRPDEVREVLETLRDLGYESRHSEVAREGFREHLYHDRVTHANGFCVEVHWGLTRPGNFIQLDPLLFQDRAGILHRPGSPDLRVPSPEDMILHTVSQSEQDGVRRLRRLVDLDRIAASRELDWVYVHHQAREAGLHGLLCVTLRLCNLLLGTPAPKDLLGGESLTPLTRRGIAIMRPVRRLLRKPKRGGVSDYYLFRLWCQPSWQERSRWFRDQAFGETDPLGWVWAGEEEPESHGGGPSHGILLVMKLLAYQILVFGCSLGVGLRRGGIRALRFWERSP